MSFFARLRAAEAVGHALAGQDGVPWSTSVCDVRTVQSTAGDALVATVEVPLARKTFLVILKPFVRRDCKTWSGEVEEWTDYRATVDQTHRWRDDSADRHAAP